MTKLILFDYDVEYFDFLSSILLDNVNIIDTVDISSSLLSSDISWNTVTHLAFVFNNNDFFPFSIDFSYGFHYFGNDMYHILETIYNSIETNITVDFISTKFGIHAKLDLDLFNSLYSDKIHFRYPNINNLNLSKYWTLMNMNLNTTEKIDFKLIYFDDDIVNYDVRLYDYSNKLHLKYKTTTYIDSSNNVNSIDDILFKEYDYQFKNDDIYLKKMEPINTKIINENLQNVREVAYNSKAISTINGDYTISVWGDPEYGGNLRDSVYGINKTISFTYGSSYEDLTNITKIVSNEKAFAAITSFRNIVTWGDPEYGGSILDVSYGTLYYTDALTYGFVDIFSTSSAFAAIDVSGKVITWGDSLNGGSTLDYLNASTLDNGVIHIFSNPYAFVAIKDNNDIVTWGNFEYGGFINNDTLVQFRDINVTLNDIIDASFQLPNLLLSDEQRNSFASSIDYNVHEKKLYVGIHNFDGKNNGCVKTFMYNDISFVDISNNTLTSDGSIYSNKYVDTITFDNPYSFSNYVVHNDIMYLAPYNDNLFRTIRLTDFSYNSIKNLKSEWNNPNYISSYSDVILFQNRYIVYVPYQSYTFEIYDSSNNVFLSEFGYDFSFNAMFANGKIKTLLTTNDAIYFTFTKPQSDPTYSKIYIYSLSSLFEPKIKLPDKTSYSTAIKVDNYIYIAPNEVEETISSCNILIGHSILDNNPYDSSTSLNYYVNYDIASYYPENFKFENMFLNIEHYNTSLFFIPKQSSYIGILDIENIHDLSLNDASFSSLSFQNLNLADTNIDISENYQNQILFSSSIRVDDKVYIVPNHYHSMCILDLTTQHIEFVHLSDSLKFISGSLYSHMNVLVMYSVDTPEIGLYNLENNTFDTVDLSDNFNPIKITNPKTEIHPDTFDINTFILHDVTCNYFFNSLEYNQKLYLLCGNNNKIPYFESLNYNNNFGTQLATSNDGTKMVVLSKNKPSIYNTDYIEIFNSTSYGNGWFKKHFDISGQTQSNWKHSNINNIIMSGNGNVVVVSDISSSTLFTFHFDDTESIYKHNNNNIIFDASFSSYNNNQFGEKMQISDNGDILVVSCVSHQYCGVIMVYFYESETNTWIRSYNHISDIDINNIHYTTTTYDGVGFVFSINDDADKIAYTNITNNTVYMYDIDKINYNVKPSLVTNLIIEYANETDVIKLYNDYSVQLYTHNNSFIGIFIEYKYDNKLYSWNKTDIFVDDLSDSSFYQQMYNNTLFSVIDNSIFYYTFGIENPPKTKTVYSNKFAFALLDTSNNLYCWGHPSYGGRNDVIPNVYDVFSTERAFSALLYDASMNVGTEIISWGLKEYGGDMYDISYGFKINNNEIIQTATQSSDISSVGPFKNIVSTQYAFAAHTYDNKIYTWGHSTSGGNIYDPSYGINNIYKNPNSLPNIISLSSTADGFIAMDDNNTTHIWGNTQEGCEFKTYFLKQFIDISFTSNLNDNGVESEDLNLTLHNHVISFVYDTSNILHQFQNKQLYDSSFSKDLFELKSTYGLYPYFTFLFNDGDVFYVNFDEYDNLSFQLLDISHCNKITFYEETFNRPVTFLMETSYNNINELFVYLPTNNIKDIHKINISDIQFIFASENAYCIVTNDDKLFYNHEPHNYNIDFTNKRIYNVFIDSLLGSNLNFIMIDIVSERLILFDPYRTETLYILEDIIQNSIPGKSIINVIENISFEHYGVFHVDVSYNNMSYETILLYNINNNTITNYDDVFNDTNQIVQLHHCDNYHFTVETSNNMFYAFDQNNDTSFNIHNIPENITVFTSHYDDTYFGLNDTTTQMYFWKGNSNTFTTYSIANSDFTIQDISAHSIYHFYKNSDALQNVYKIAFLMNNQSIKIFGDTSYDHLFGDYSIDLSNGDISGITFGQIEHIHGIKNMLICKDVSNNFTLLSDISYNENGYSNFKANYYYVNEYYDNSDNKYETVIFNGRNINVYIRNLETIYIPYTLSDISYAVGDDILFTLSFSNVPQFIDPVNNMVYPIDINYASRIFEINSRAFIVECYFDYLNENNIEIQILEYYILKITNTSPSDFAFDTQILKISKIDFVVNFKDYLLVSCVDNTVHYFYQLLNVIFHNYVHIYNLDNVTFAKNIVIKKDENDTYFAFHPFIPQNTKYISNLNYKEFLSGVNIQKYNVGNNFLFTYNSSTTGSFHIYHCNSLSNIALHHNDFAILETDTNFSAINVYVSKVDFIIETSDSIYIYNSNAERGIALNIVVDTVYISDYCFFLICSELDSIISLDYHTTPKFFNLKTPYTKIENVVTHHSSCAILTLNNELYIYDKNNGLVWSDVFIEFVEKNKYYYIIVTLNNVLKLFDTNKNKLSGIYNDFHDINIPNTYKYITSEKCSIVVDNSGNFYTSGNNASIVSNDIVPLLNMSGYALYDSLFLNSRKTTSFYNLPDIFYIDTNTKTMYMTRSIEYHEIKEGATIFLEDDYTFDGLYNSIDFNGYQTDGIFERVISNIFYTSKIYIVNLIVMNGGLKLSAGGFVKKNSFGFHIKDCISHFNLSSEFGTGKFFGSNCYDCSIVGSYSSGDISNNSGGIFGSDCYRCDVSACYSLGRITGYSGGMFGYNCIHCNISSSYTYGNANIYSGAMFGSENKYNTVSNSFSRSLLDVSSHSVCGISSEYITCSEYYSYINEVMDEYYQNNFYNNFDISHISHIRFDNSLNLSLNPDDYLYIQSEYTYDTAILKHFTQPPWNPGFYKVNSTQAFYTSIFSNNFNFFNFRYSDISNIDFATATFDYSTFYSCNLMECSFNSSNFEYTLFEKSNIENCKIDDFTNFENTGFFHTTSSGLDISNTSNIFSSFPSIFISNGSIFASNISHEKTMFNGVTFRDIVFPQQTNFYKVTMINTTFINCVFKYTNFEEVFMSTTTKFINSYFTYVSSNNLYLTDLSDNSLTYETMYSYIDDDTVVFNNSPPDYINSPYITIVDGHLIMRGMKYSNVITITNKTITLKKPSFDLTQYSSDVAVSDDLVKEIYNYVDNIATYFTNIEFVNCVFDGSANDYDNIIVDSLFENNNFTIFTDCDFSKLQSINCNFYNENNQDGFFYVYNSNNDFYVSNPGLYILNSKLVGGNIDLSGLDLTNLFDSENTTDNTVDISNIFLSGNIVNVFINDKVDLTNARISTPSIDIKLLNINGELYNSFENFPAYPNYMVHDGHLIGNFTDLSGMDLRGVNLSGMNLNGILLDNAIFDNETYIINTTFLNVESDLNLIYDNSLNLFTSDQTFPSWPFSVVFQGQLFAKGVTLNQEIINEYYNAGHSFEFLNLSDCNLSNIDFSGIDISGLIISNSTDLTNTTYDKNTKDYIIYDITGERFTSDILFPSYDLIQVRNGKIIGPGTVLSLQ